MPPRQRTPEGPPPAPAVQKLRVKYARRGRRRFASTRDFGRALERALRRAEVPMAVSAGFHPHPKISYANGAPTGTASQAEYFEISVTERVDAVCASGVARERILIDPGFGFGKTLAHNLALFRALPQLSSLTPVLAGVSRKSMLGAITGQPVEARVVASAVAAALAVQLGAVCVRVHDVAATRDALAVLDAVRS